MNEYMKPDYEVMVFEPNEYVAACDPTTQHWLELSCISWDSPITALATWNSGSTNQAYGGSDYYVFNSSGSSVGEGSVLITGFHNETEDYYAFYGQINDHYHVPAADSGMQSTSGGEFSAATHPDPNDSNKCSGCGFNLFSTTTTHHHVRYEEKSQVFVNSSN